MSQSFESFGKYILLEKIQTGGMAEIYLARKPGASGVSKFIAIKRILPQYSEQTEFIDMFKDEAKIAVNLAHANIVSIHEFGVERNQFFLAMDYVEGRNLRQILNKMKKSGVSFSVEQVLFVIKEVASGLDHAHRCIDANTGKPLNIIHRDMSPQNVMVSFEGEVKVVDFGIAKAETQIDSTRAGTLKGKFGYMSPEQAEGQVVDLRTDIFALGIVLWELLANDRLFVANNEVNTLRKVRDCQIPSLRKINPNIPTELERIVGKALAKDRNLRYQTAAAFQRELSRFLNRQYPDFSQHDFSVFIKTLFAAEILESRKKMVEFSKMEAKQEQAQLAPPKPSRAESIIESTNSDGGGGTRTENTESPDLFEDLNKMPPSQQRAQPAVAAPTAAAKPRRAVHTANGDDLNTKSLGLDRRSYNDRQAGKIPDNFTSGGSTYHGTREFSKVTVKQGRGFLGTIMPILMIIGAVGLGGFAYTQNKPNALTPILCQAGIIHCEDTTGASHTADDTLDPKPTKKSTFELNVSSVPSGADFYVDDKPIGVTPDTYQGPKFSEVKLTIKKDGYATLEQKVKLDQNINIKLNLLPERVAKLDIHVVGAGQIFVDGKLIAENSPAFDVSVPANKDVEVKAVDRVTSAVDTVRVHLKENETKKITLIPRAFKKNEVPKTMTN